MARNGPLLRPGGTIRLAPPPLETCGCIRSDPIRFVVCYLLCYSCDQLITWFNRQTDSVLSRLWCVQGPSQSLTQSSLADVCPGGSAHNKLRIRDQLLMDRDTLR